MRFCRGFICFLNSEIRLECALFVPYRPKKCFTRWPDAHIFSGKQAIKKRTCRRPLKCCSQAVSTARKVLCTSCIASRYCDYVPDALRKRELVGAWPLHLLSQTVLSLKSPTGAFIAPLRCANANLSGRGPSICSRRPFCRSNTPLGCLLLRKRELLRTRHFRQSARKHAGNFGKKREGWTVPALLTRKSTRLFITIKL